MLVDVALIIAKLASSLAFSFGFHGMFYFFYAS